MQDCKGIKTPMPTNGHLGPDENGKDYDQKVYRSVIGSLLYLCASRPDISAADADVVVLLQLRLIFASHP